MAISTPVRSDVRLAPVSLEAWMTTPVGWAPSDAAGLMGRSGDHWTLPGQPTVRLASDPGVAVAEAGRTWAVKADEMAVKADEMAIWSARVTLDAVADLRRRDLWSRVTIPDDPCWILDRERCRGVAGRLRDEGDADGMIVPSAVVLDDPRRFAIVVFVERLRRDLLAAVQTGRMEMVLRTAAPHPTAT